MVALLDFLGAGVGLLLSVVVLIPPVETGWRIDGLRYIFGHEKLPPFISPSSCRGCAGLAFGDRSFVAAAGWLDGR